MRETVNVFPVENRVQELTTFYVIPKTRLGTAI